MTHFLRFPILSKQLGAAEAAGVGQGRRGPTRPAQPPRTLRARLAPSLLLIFTHYHYPLPPEHYTTHEKSQPTRYRCFMRTSGIVSPIKLRTLDDRDIYRSVRYRKQRRFSKTSLLAFYSKRYKNKLRDLNRLSSIALYYCQMIDGNYYQSCKCYVISTINCFNVRFSI